MRIKRSVNAKKKKKKMFKATKGFMSIRKSCYSKAKEAFYKAGKHAYKHRREKKRERRALWQIKIGNAVKLEQLSYSKFIHLLKKKNISLNRKVLAQIAENHPEIFKKIVAHITK